MEVIHVTIFSFQHISFALFGTALWFLGTVIQLFQGNLPYGRQGNTRVVMVTPVTMHTMIALLFVFPYIFASLGTHRMIHGTDLAWQH